jgi:hypothetical protein
MTIRNTELIKRPHHYYKTKLGDVYFFDRFFIAEFNEGLDIDFSSFSEIDELIKTHFGNKTFAFISNRVNSYSIVLGDAQLFNTRYPNCTAYAIVAYKPFTEKVIEIENKFFSFNRRAFRSIEKALDWVESTLQIEM